MVERKIRIAQSALEDLQAIQAYYREQDVPHIGDEFAAAILEHCEMLQIHPDAGRVVPEFNLDHIRELIHAPFGVFTSGRLKRLCSYESGEVKGSSNYQKTKHNQAMHRMLILPLSSLRYVKVTGAFRC